MAVGEEKPHMEEETHLNVEAASSEDDREMMPGNVQNYWLEDGQENPISLSSLPFLPDEGKKKQQQSIFLRGTTDGGLQRVYVEGEAWQIDFSKDGNPVFLLRTGGKHWIELSKPRKSYEDIIRSLLVVAQFLDFIQRNPDASEKNVWNHLHEAFRSYEIKPSSSDLSPHANVIDYYMRLKGLESLPLLNSAMSPSSRKRAAITTASEAVCSSAKSENDGKVSDNGAGDFNTETDEQFLDSGKKQKHEDSFDLEEGAEGLSGEEDFEEVGDLSEAVCAICDNGGDVLCCEGPCMRSFHLNKEADGAEDSSCSTLGFSKKEVEKMEKYFCPNCQYKQHQCFACGELGCSDDSLGPAQEVFICDVAICGRFYHPLCVAKLLLSEDENAGVKSLAQGIKDGQGFSCPIHKCKKCGRGEVAEEEDFQFALCRRCPRAWHRKCLPSSISFEETDDGPERAWEGLLSNNRILVYCMRHKLDPDLATPRRDHIKFPGRSGLSSKGAPKKKPEMQTKKRKLDGETKVKEDVQIKKSKSDTQVTKSKSDLDSTKPNSKSESNSLTVKNKPVLDRNDSQTKRSKAELSTPQTYLKEKLKRDSDSKVKTISASSKAVKIEKDTTLKDIPLPKIEKVTTLKDAPLRKIVSPSGDISLKKREKSVASEIIFSVKETEIKSTIEEIIKRSRESTTLESIIDRHNMPKCYQRNHKSPDKKYSLTKIESIIKAMRRAVETMDKGGSIEDAKTKCSGAFVKFLDGCQKELKVYLAPFLHGMRYTSFGRHFTRYDKLQDIVSRLQWYIQDGDMIVDMCCGSNDFSILMRDQMKRAKKNCEFKNFDIILPKNDFNFTKQDWFQVKPDELASGSRLIIGLNPPFGHKGGLANSFINQALKFKPKLIILIVPKETERLDQKLERYTLIWEDPNLLKGDSFYLPGSVDVNKNPLNDWNLVAPPLYLWSRPDWVQRHQEIAMLQGHISKKSISDPSPRYTGEPWKGHLLALDPLPYDSKSESFLPQINYTDKLDGGHIVAPIYASTGDEEIAGKLDTVAVVPEATIQHDDVATFLEGNMLKDIHVEPVNQMDAKSNLMRNFERNKTGKVHKKNLRNGTGNQSREYSEVKYDVHKVNNRMEENHFTSKSAGDRQVNKSHNKGKNQKNSPRKDKADNDRFQRHADIDRDESHGDKDRHSTRGVDRFGRLEDKERHIRGNSLGEEKAHKDRFQRHGDVDRQEKDDDRRGNRSKHYHLGKYNHKDKNERYRPRDQNDVQDKQNDQRTSSPDRYAHKPELLQASHTGREHQMGDDRRTPEMNDARGRQRSSKLSEAEFGYPESTIHDKMECYEDDSKKRKDLSDRDAIVKAGHLDDSYISREFSSTRKDLPDAYTEESRRRELIDSTFSMDKMLNSADREMHNQLGLYGDFQKREISDSDVQSRKLAYSSRDYSQQVAMSNYDRHYSDRDYDDTGAVDSHMLKILGTLPPQGGTVEPYDPSLNIHQKVNHRYLNMQSGREQGHSNYDEFRTQVSPLDFESSRLRCNYNSSDTLASVHERNRSSVWPHEPYQPRQPGELLNSVPNAGPAMSSWTKSTQSRQHSESNIDSLLESVLGPRRDANFSGHAPYSAGGRYGESRPYYPH